ncbi:MAG TPA: hypothetical protein VMW29_02465 [Candidatus Bathyarchaeia archaeon]|nr:hypothetical protein [Candidatus Bathyarchaeia archaeon]
MFQVIKQIPVTNKNYRIFFSVFFFLFLVSLFLTVSLYSKDKSLSEFFLVCTNCFFIFCFSFLFFANQGFKHDYIQSKKAETLIAIVFMIEGFFLIFLGSSIWTNLLKLRIAGAGVVVVTSLLYVYWKFFEKA